MQPNKALYDLMYHPNASSPGPMLCNPPLPFFIIFPCTIFLVQISGIIAGDPLCNNLPAPERERLFKEAQQEALVARQLKEAGDRAEADFLALLATTNSIGPASTWASVKPQVCVCGRSRLYRVTEVVRVPFDMR